MIKAVATHAGLLLASATVLCPLFIITWLSFGAPGLGGNLATLMHWKLLFNLPVTTVNGELLTPDLPALTWLWNSLRIALIFAVTATALAAMSAYALVRKSFIGKRVLNRAILLVQFLPSVLALVAVYILLRKVGGYFPLFGVNSPLGLGLAYLGGLAFYIWILKGQITNLPSTFEESARISGASQWQILWRVIIPLIMPGLMITFLIAFAMAYSELPLATILLQDKQSYTLAIGAGQYLAQQQFYWGEFAAFALLSSLPAIFLLLLLQRWLLRANRY
ncbi:ABC transporter permease subunit [Motilimonas pumila]|nr:ABC transporter permease subunit [Motilimonas pumila]